MPTRCAQEMFRALAAEFGERRWAVSLRTTRVPRELGCNGDDDAETVILPCLLLRRGLPGAEWKKAAKIVEKVGRAHGFDVVKVVVDRPGDFTMTGPVEGWGGATTSGWLKNTVIGIRTGCHVWDDKPAPVG